MAVASTDHPLWQQASSRVEDQRGNQSGVETQLWCLVRTGEWQGPVELLHRVSEQLEDPEMILSGPAGDNPTSSSLICRRMATGSGYVFIYKSH